MIKYNTGLDFYLALKLSYYENNDYPKSNFSKFLPPAAIVLLGGIFIAFPTERE
jgi:hypothetical protein